MDKPLGWYYAWFPTTTSFLESGALMTGEASPGYLPYPEVVHEVSKLLPGPKFIVVGRNPIQRIYSSYRYNYVQPALEYLKKGRMRGIDGRQPDAYYQKWLFSLEDFVRAELKQLKDCLFNFGPEATRQQWYHHKKWTQAEFDKRASTVGDPLIDLDQVCYGGLVNRTVLRPQWAEMQLAHPEKILLSRGAFLTQAIIGRSLYVFPLEWWYILLDPNDILFVCTEDLSKPEVLNDLALELGLPSYNFSDVVSEGAYNVGGHRGYDKATSWQDLKHDDDNNDDDGIPLSTELRRELEEFLQPLNERLFRLTGKRCDW
jgi:hypothetical protein